MQAKTKRYLVEKTKSKGLPVGTSCAKSMGTGDVRFYIYLDMLFPTLAKFKIESTLKILDESSN